MEKPSLRKNYLFMTAYQVLSLLVPLITTPYLSRTLGADSVGVYSFSSATASYFILFSVLGTKIYGQKQIATVRNNKDDLSKSFWELFIIRCISASIALIIYYSFVVCRVQSYKVIYIILSLGILDVIFDITWFFQGIENFGKLVTRNLVLKIINLICVFCFIKSPNDLWLYILFIYGFSNIGNLIMWLYVKPHIHKIQVNQINIHQHLKSILLLFLPTVAVQIYQVLDKTMIGVITMSTYQNGCYEQAEKIARMAITVVTSAAAVFLPRVANLYNNNNEKKAIEYVYLAFRFTWFLGLPIMFGIIGITKVLVPVFLGDGYELANTLLPIFSLLVIFISISYVSGYSFLIPIGKQNVYTIAVFCGAVVNLLMNLCLIPIIGAIGAAIASVCAEGIGALIQLLYCTRRNLLEFRQIIRESWKYWTASIIMLTVLMIIGKLLPCSVLALIILIILGGCIYFLVLLLLQDSFLIENSARIYRRFVKKRKEV